MTIAQMTRRAMSAARQTFADVLKTVRGDLEKLVNVADDAAKASAPTLNELAKTLLPHLPRDANGRVDFKSESGQKTRAAIDAMLRDIQKTSSRYTETHRQYKTPQGVPVWGAESDLLARGAKREDLDKLPAFTASAAIAFNEAKIKYDAAVRSEILDPLNDRMGTSRRQVLHQLVKKANASAAKRGSNDTKDVTKPLKARIDAHTKARKDGGHKVDAAKVKAGWAMIRKGWGYTK